MCCFGLSDMCFAPIKTHPCGATGSWAASQGIVAKLTARMSRIGILISTLIDPLSRAGSTVWKGGSTGKSMLDSGLHSRLYS
jgi:hypothetical protein